jgi:hypothetical protein
MIVTERLCLLVFDLQKLIGSAVHTFEHDVEEDVQELRPSGLA